jgi:hypothetical protein
LKEIIGDFVPQNGLSQEVFNEHYIDYVNKMHIDFDSTGESYEEKSSKSSEFDNVS